MRPQRLGRGMGYGRIHLTSGIHDNQPYVDDHASIQISVALAAMTVTADVIITGNMHNVLLWRNCSGPWESVQLKDPRWALVDKTLSFFGIDSARFVVNYDVPYGVGLGSSGALAVALTRALLDAQGLEWDPQEIAEAAIAIERSTGAATGKQDQYSAAFGCWHRFTFHGQSTTVEEVPLDASDIRVLERGMLIAVPGGSRQASSAIISGIMERYRHGDVQTTKLLECLNALVPPVWEALTQADAQALGVALRDVYAAQYALVLGNVDDKVKQLNDALIQHPWAGAALQGCGGAGGCLLIAFDPRRRHSVERMVREAGCEPLRLDTNPMVSCAAPNLRAQSKGVGDDGR